MFWSVDGWLLERYREKLHGAFGKGLAEINAR